MICEVYRIGTAICVTCYRRLGFAGGPAIHIAGNHAYCRQHCPIHRTMPRAEPTALSDEPEGEKGSAGTERKTNRF